MSDDNETTSGGTHSTGKEIESSLTIAALMDSLISLPVSLDLVRSRCPPRREHFLWRFVSRNAEFGRLR